MYKLFIDLVFLCCEFFPNVQLQINDSFKYQRLNV